MRAVRTNDDHLDRAQALKTTGRRFEVVRTLMPGLSHRDGSAGSSANLYLG